MTGLLQDLRYRVRQLRKSPGFTLTALLSIPLGIGATTAIFSVVYSMLLDPLHDPRPYRDPGRMVHVQLPAKSAEGDLLSVPVSEYQELLRASSLVDVFLQIQRTQTRTGAQLPISVLVGQYTTNLFSYMGVPPLLGRERRENQRRENQ